MPLLSHLPIKIAKLKAREILSPQNHEIKYQ